MMARQSDLIHRSRRLWNTIAWFAAVTFGLLAIWVRHSGLLPGDMWGLTFIQAHARGVHLFAFIGSLAGVIGLTLIVGWIYRRWLNPIVLVVLMAGTPVLEETLKILVHRARPTGQDLGFPSGHAIASLTLALLVCGAVWRALSGWGKLAAVLVSAVFVVGVITSRAAMGLHWPSDIVGGWLVALAYGLWTVPLVRQRNPGRG